MRRIITGVLTMAALGMALSAAVAEDKTPDATLKLTTDTPDQLAGTLTIDDSKAGGAKVTVKFDAKTAKSFSK